MPEKSTKSCLLISYGPVPTPQYQTVEGGGMRIWGLAEGLKDNGVDVTVGVNASFPQELTEHEGVKLVTWSLDGDFARLINTFDAVVISYNMGDPSVFVADHIADDVQLVLDAYVPIYIEVSARESKDIETEYVNYMADIARHNHVLKRGDYFLFANDAQEQLYDGVLSALGIINPRSYRETRLVKTPFGIHRTPVKAAGNPYKELGIEDDAFVVMWFGGIYPWFRIQEYLDAIKLLATDKKLQFVFVGGKNPFNPNPDFFRQYETAVNFAKDNKFMGTKMHFVDWVDFQDRVDYFVHADVIVSLNQPGDENKYSWRTRVMDFVWGEAVTISNGGDPLSEELIASKAAIRIESLDAGSLAKAIRSVREHPTTLIDAKKQLRVIKEKYFWDVVTKQLANIIDNGTLPYASEASFREMAGTDNDAPTTANAIPVSKARRLAGVPIKVARKIRQKGVIRTARIAANVLRTQAKNRTPAARHSQFVFISHPINNTGAPIVLLQVIEEYVREYGASRVRVIAPGIEKEQRQHLKKLGISVEQAVFGIGFHFIRMQLGLRPNDTVIMNTAAIYDNYRDFILLWLRNKRLKHAYWFIHEDPAQLPLIHKEFLDSRNLSQIKSLVKNGSLSLMFPSKRTAQEYEEIIGIEKANVINLRVDVPEKYKKPRSEASFDTIDFLLSGTASDGRKGQLLALAAFYTYYKEYAEKNPDSYRPFRLHLVAVGKKDYISQQIRWIAGSQLGDKVKIYEPLPKDEALDITAACNAVVCCSLNETFGLYIAEGMLMHQVVVRNNCAGMEEQLHPGKNGILIDHTDIKQFADGLETLLNKSKMTNRQLAAMGNESKRIIDAYGEHSYLSQIQKI